MCVDCEGLVPWALLDVWAAVEVLAQGGGDLLRARSALVVRLFESLGGADGYNAVSSLVHTVRIVPGLLAEPSVFSVYEEIFVRPAGEGFGAAPLGPSSEPIRRFALLLAAIAMQAFPTLSHHQRLEKLLEWIQEHEHHSNATNDEIT